MIGTLLTLATTLGLPAGGGVVGLVLGHLQSRPARIALNIAKRAARGEHLSDADKQVAREWHEQNYTQQRMMHGWR